MTEESNSDGMTKRLVRAGAASAASALLAYGIRKAVPALREKLNGIGNGSAPGGDTLAKAKDAVSGKFDAATSAVSDRIGGGSSSTSNSSRSGSALSRAELDTRLEERAKRRSERQKALTS